MKTLHANIELKELVDQGFAHAINQRKELDTHFPPFLIFYQNGELNYRVLFAENAFDMAEKTLEKEDPMPSFFVFGSEASISENNLRKDVIVLKAYHKDLMESATYFHRFTGLEDGGNFKLEGDFTYGGTEPHEFYPNDNLEEEDVYISGMTLKQDSSLIKHAIIVGHKEVPVVFEKCQELVWNILQRNNPQFNGEIDFEFVPGSIPNTDEVMDHFGDLKQSIENHPYIIDYGKALNRKIIINFSHGDNILEEDKVPDLPFEKPIEPPKKKKKKDKRWWEFWK